MLSNLSSQANELKSQGAVEAAQDPHSKIDANDARKTLMDEAKKAGGAAYEFNPDASPEEKAATARADDGTPDQYDLPSPSHTAISEPSSLTTGKANGRAPNDKGEWDKVGWAPRFGPGSINEEDANASLLDHATYLESKLDDKFFGDWYHNTAVIIFACLSSWLVALLGGGLAWVFLVMAVCGTYYRTSMRRVRRNYRDDVSREMAKARLDTDHESLEWINSFLVKFWPIYAPVLCATIVASVDQVLSTATPAFLDSMRMKFFTLGTKPPRLEHVKTYPKADDDIVLMDWKFSFTPNDVMDLTARQLKNKVQPKVILEVRLGKGVISKGLDVIVEDFAFSGLMRVKVKLQIPFPHVEKIEICFLERPTIDYVCKPLGGDTFGFDLNFIPGLESFISEQIHANLQPIMYDPNVFPIEIAKMLAGNPVDQAIGVMAVTIHGAQGLKNSDKLAGSPDPYAVVSLNSRDVLGKTKIIKQNANPRWNETIYVIITSYADTLTMQVFDFNEFRKDKELGTASFALDRLEQDAEYENLHLEIMAAGKNRGLIQADVRFFPVLGGVKGADGQDEPPPESNTGIARFTVEQAKDLDGSKSLIGQLNPYAVLLLNGKEIHVTQKLKRTNQPVWANGSKEFLVTDRKAARLGLVIKDDRDIAADPIIGTYQIKLDDMMRQVEAGKEWYNLHGVASGRAKLLLQWKPVALKGIMGGSGGYITPIGIMRLHFQGARDLRNVETMGKSDPYARVLLSGIAKGKTVTFENNLNPDWDEVIYVPMHSSRERLTLEVMDYQNIGKDRSLGLVELNASDFISEADDGTYKVHDHKTLVSAPLRMNGVGAAKGKLNYTAAFYPTLSIADPDEESDEKTQPLAPTTNGKHSRQISKASVATAGSKESIDGADPVAAANKKDSNAGRIDTSLATQMANAEKEEEQGEAESKEVPKIKLTAEDLPKYESGLLVFKLIDGELSRSGIHLEVLMDDMAFPSYVSTKAASRQAQFGETGDAFIKEIDVSRIRLRLAEKEDKKGEGESEHVLAKLEGDTLPLLRRCLYKPTELVLKSSEGGMNKIRVSLKYLPVKMRLDPSESINNQGTLRVDVLDAADLPSADRNGYSDPYCKFELNGQSIFKTKVQKKTLHPSWNEYFETPISSRTAAKFQVHVMDWDFGDKADLLGNANINLEILEPNQAQEVTLALDGKSGVLRLRLLFRSAYVTRSRQGSATFSGTFAVPGKVIGAPVKGVGKVGGMVGGGVVKGATFLKHGIRGSKDKNETSVTNGNFGNEKEAVMDGDGAVAMPSIEGTDTGTTRVASIGSGLAAPTTPVTPHNRSTSFGGKSFLSAAGSTPGSGGKGDEGTASFTIVSASGYPPSTKVQVYIKQMSPKGAKDVHKTKALKVTSSTTPVTWGDSEAFKVQCTADTQFQLHVKDDKLFGDEDLGEAPLFVNDSQGSGQMGENTVKAGSGTIVVRSAFVLKEDSGAKGDSPRINRRSFLTRKDHSRQETPT
ncbi:hypothetical protein MMC25_003087 [Agyrium rufum]|nr:hypothetical protein [Agyrium rufum]